LAAAMSNLPAFVGPWQRKAILFQASVLQG
jgi:hypothetical protein